MMGRGMRAIPGGTQKGGATMVSTGEIIPILNGFRDFIEGVPRLRSLLNQPCAAGTCVRVPLTKPHENKGWVWQNGAGSE